ncbi:MAG: hypothetical protein QM813_06425 [Verrucomicrobiota bacterium]
MIKILRLLPKRVWLTQLGWWLMLQIFHVPKKKLNLLAKNLNLLALRQYL